MEKHISNMDELEKVLQSVMIGMVDALTDHEVRCNCTIIDLHDRSVIAGITDRHITSGLAIRTLQKALDSQPAIKGGLVLHSD